MNRNRLFSVRETLLGPGEAGALFQQCLVEAKRFIDTTSIAGMLDFLFDRKENRCAVAGAARDILHVGFIFPDEALTFADMGRASTAAGFCSDHFTFASTVISRELGEFLGRPQVPTTIFTARAAKIHERSGYVEAFIPAEEKKRVRTWVEAEVGTHIGLTLTDPSMFPAVQDAFQAEGFQIPSFMQGEPIANFDAGVAVIYYEKPCGAGKLRIEVLLPLDGASR